jgi:hypothetical protein
MPMVTECEPPPSSLLLSLRDGGAFTDSYCVDVQRTVTHIEFVGAFYTTRLFKLERALLRFLARKPSTDRMALELALGQREDFAVWRIERREPNQVLLTDQSGRTRSWLMIAPLVVSNGSPATRLYFGSALIPKIDRITGEKRFGALFAALLGFHRMYSRALLRATAAQLAETSSRS